LAAYTEQSLNKKHNINRKVHDLHGTSENLNDKFTKCKSQNRVNRVQTFWVCPNSVNGGCFRHNVGNNKYNNNKNTQNVNKHSRLKCQNHFSSGLNLFLFISPFSPDIKMYILLTVLNTFHIELVRRICLNIETSFPW